MAGLPEEAHSSRARPFSVKLLAGRLLTLDDMVELFNLVLELKLSEQDKKDLVVAVLVVSVPFPAFAEKTADTVNVKEECLLASRNCRGNMDSLQQRVTKLNAKIGKEERGYSPEDLKRLDEKLKEANDLSDKMMSYP